MKDFIHQFSAGKISLKYNLVTPEVSDKFRKVISILFILFSFLILLAILKVYERFPYYNSGFAILIGLLFVIVTGKITEFFILGLKIHGKVVFKEHQFSTECKKRTFLG